MMIPDFKKVFIAMFVIGAFIGAICLAVVTVVFN